MLKVGSPRPDFDEPDMTADMPPMEDTPDMGGNAGPEMGSGPDQMGNDMPPMDDNGMGGGPGFEDEGPDDGGFDGGFDDGGDDADDEQDPKKHIQKLAGELSQSLRQYNDENGEPDVELCKYVAGMINSQAIKGLSEDDADEVLSKIKSGDDFSEGDEDDDDFGMDADEGDGDFGGDDEFGGDDFEADDNMQQEPQMNAGNGGNNNNQEMPMESVRRRKKMVDEAFDAIFGNRNQMTNKPKRSNNPFKSPRFT